MNRIPVLDLGQEIDALEQELVDAFRRVLASRTFILGPEVEAFERELASFLGARHVVGVNSGTDALLLGLRSLGLGPGDEVITTTFTFAATAEAIVLAGATPVLVDVGPDTLNLDLDGVAAALGPRTRAIVPVHLFGRPVDRVALRALAVPNSVAIVEDVAQALGAHDDLGRVGAGSTVGAFSFFPSKNLGGFGDGGAVATDDDERADTLRALRAHGARTKYANEILGYNSRLDALQAALLRVKLPLVDDWNARRRAVADRYRALLGDLEGDLEGNLEGIVLPGPAPGHVHHQMTIRVRGGRRDDVRRALSARGVDTAVYYPAPLHLLAPYRRYAPTPLPHAERAAAEVLSLPMGPFLSDDDVARVAEALREAVGAAPTSRHT